MAFSVTITEADLLKTPDLLDVTQPEALYALETDWPTRHIPNVVRSLLSEVWRLRTALIAAGGRP